MNHVNKQDTRVALVTGAAKRIGKAIAHHLHQAGYCVVIHYHNSHEEARRLVDDLNRIRKNSAWLLRADLTQKQQAIDLITQTIDCATRLDLLVNNASVFLKTEANALDDDHWDVLFTTNVQAPFWLSQTAHPFLAAHYGCIINITDIHAESYLKGYPVYCQTKAALLAQTRALASDFAPRVRVNAIAPGAIAWPEQDNALSLEQQKKVIANTALKQHGDPLYIAEAVLAISDNRFITGQTLRVDGGRGL